MNENELTDRQRSIAAIATFTVRGDMERLKPALATGLDHGLTINEIKEILVQLYAYAGFPRSLNGLAAFMEVLDARAQQGVMDAAGRPPAPLPADRSSLELGTKIQTELVGAPVAGRLFDFAPAIDRFLKEHLFGDIFGRDNLDFQSREIATVAALAGMSGVASQLQAHFKIALNIGVPREVLAGLVQFIATEIGSPEGETARAALVLAMPKAER